MIKRSWKLHQERELELWSFIEIVAPAGHPAACLLKKNRKLRIEKIGKIGNFVFENRRKIGKSIVVSSTKIASLHPIRVIKKATNSQLLCLQDLDQLSRLRRGENDVYR